MSESSVEIKGAERFAATLDKASHDIAVLRDGVTEAGRIMADAASALAPVRTGALAASITETLQSAGGSAGVDITSPLVYANPVHWGVPSHNVAASLFILRGIDASEAQWSAAIEADMQRVCDSVEGI